MRTRAEPGRLLACRFGRCHCRWSSQAPEASSPARTAAAFAPAAVRSALRSLLPRRGRRRYRGHDVHARLLRASRSALDHLVADLATLAHGIARRLPYGPRPSRERSSRAASRGSIAPSVRTAKERGRSAGGSSRARSRPGTARSAVPRQGPCRTASGRIGRPASILALRRSGSHPAGGSIGESAAPMKKFALPDTLWPDISFLPVANVPCSPAQGQGIEVEHRFGVRLVAGARVVASEQQQILDAQGRRRQQIALQGEAVAVAARELQDRLDAAH